MSATHTPSAIDDRRREGARRCFEAMKRLADAAIAVEDYEDRYSDHVVRRHRDAESLLHAMAPMPPEAEGALLALAEYVYEVMAYSTEPDISDGGSWVPVSAMTQDHLLTELDRLIAIEDNADRRASA